MAFCKVTYKDIDLIEHSVNVEADSLHEAVAKAVQVFRNKLWDGCLLPAPAGNWPWRFIEIPHRR